VNAFVNINTKLVMTAIETHDSPERRGERTLVSSWAVRTWLLPRNSHDCGGPAAMTVLPLTTTSTRTGVMTDSGGIHEADGRRRVGRGHAGGAVDG
jgi:hypothetical protein